MRRTEWELLCLPPRDVKGKKVVTLVKTVCY